MNNVIRFPTATGIDRPDWDEWCAAGWRWATHCLIRDPHADAVTIFEAWHADAHGPLAFDDVVVLAMSAGIRHRLDEQEAAS